MTIAQAFNEIAVAQGGTASTSGTIAGAIDALNDALAGSDQQAAQTIEDAVRLLGQNIGSGGGGGDTEYNIYCYFSGGEPTDSYIYPCIWDETSEQWTLDTTNGAISKAKAGDILGTDYVNGIAYVQYAEGSSSPFPPYLNIGQKEFSMPAHDAYVYQGMA